MPLIPEFVQTCETMITTHRAKNDDYATGANPMFNFDVQEYIMQLFDNPRDKVFASMLGLKLGRLATQLNKIYANSKHEPNNEGVLDTFLDDAVYTVLWKADFERRQAQKKLEEFKKEQKVDLNGR